VTGADDSGLGIVTAVGDPPVPPKGPGLGMCYDPEPSPQFSIIFYHLFHALSHSSLTRSLTRRSDRHQIT